MLYGAGTFPFRANKKNHLFSLFFLEETGQFVNKIKAAHTNVFENLKEKKANCESSEKKRNLVAKLRK